MAEPLSDDEKALFSNSAYSNPYWSDSVDEEDQELIRGEITRRQQVLDEASDQMSRTPPWQRGRLKRIIGEGVVYPCEELNARSFARFQLWLAELRPEDPKQHALIVKWFRAGELKAERARVRKARARAFREELWEELRREWERSRVRRARREEEQRLNAGWNANRRDDQRIRELGDPDRRRAEANDQYGQEQAHQAAYQASQDARRSEPTCKFCDRPGMHHTASGWMCGIHLHHLM